MKTILMGVLVIGFSLWLCTCTSGCTLNAQFVDAVDETWAVVGPRYCAYVQADPQLDEESKTTRLRTAQLLTETIAEAQK